MLRWCPAPELEARHRQLLKIAALVACLTPVFLSFNYVYRFAVDVPFWDQWELVPLLARMAGGTLQFRDLFSQHNEHRILFPRLLMLILARFDHWNTRIEQMVGWVLLLGVGALLLYDHLRGLGRGLVAWFSFVPVAWLIFSLRQSENLLWGWQLTLMLATLAFVASMVTLASEEAGIGRTLIAIAFAVVSTYSFAAGLAAWPAGVVCILTQRARRSQRLILWTVAAIIVAVLYLWGYSRPGHHPAPELAISHFPRLVYFFTAMLGGSLAAEGDVVSASAVGCTLLFVAVVLAALWQTRVLQLYRTGVGPALVAFAVGTTALTAIGRVGFDLGPDGIGMATSSRYTTLTALGVYGLYRGILVLPSEKGRPPLLGCILTLLFLGAVVALESEYPVGIRVMRERQAMRQILATWRERPDTELQRLYLAPLIRERAPLLESLHLSVFRTQR